MAVGKARSDSEREFRGRWYEQVRADYEADHDQGADWADRLVDVSGQGLAIRDRLAASRDVEAFRSEYQDWVNETKVGLNWSAFLVNGLVKHVDDRQHLTDVLLEAIAVPETRTTAASRINQLVELMETSGPRVRRLGTIRVAHLLSSFWGMEQADRWPVAYPTARSFVNWTTGQTEPEDKGEHYLRFMDLVDEVEEDYLRFIRVAGWADENPTRLVAPVLVDRCAFGLRDKPASPEDREDNAAALRSMSEHIGATLRDTVEKALGSRTKIRKPSLLWKPGRPRADLWVDWRIDAKGPGVRVWINQDGLAVGVIPGAAAKGWFSTASEIAASAGVPGFDLMKARTGHMKPGEKGFYGQVGFFIYGRWYDRDQLSDLDVGKAVSEVTHISRDLIKRLEEARDPTSPTTRQPVTVSPSALYLENPPPPPDPIEAAAADLLIDRGYLQEIVDLLEDKGQIIFYGPPGTSKTYVAQRLAEALAPELADRVLVQFHPSTSYEDFFEGYRPHQTKDGGITYRLTPGPLARIADRASGGRKHVMVIDEINRANLPKVLGELLFLLEYRDQSTATLYRPEGDFKLPSSLWFIGTMNTADRSIALVDAALRRRFHFVPFFPDRPPIEGLLARWLKREGQPAWVGDFVDFVNVRLGEEVGDDLQLGPSYFMKEGYGSVADDKDCVLRQVWKYNIEPFIEDQLFGDLARIERFRLPRIMRTFRQETQSEDRPSEDTLE